MSIIAIDPGRKNLALCMIDRDGRIRKWAVLALETSSARGLADALTELEFDEWTAEADVAVIERQPAKNPSMKAMQHYLEMACTMRGVPTATIDPKLKLTAAQASGWWPDRPVYSWGYAERKKLAVETVTNMLHAGAQTPESGAQFFASKKKDDLADAFLTALAFQRSPVPVERPHVRRFKPKKPTERQVASGAYSQAALKYVAKGLLGSYDAFREGTAAIHGFVKSCERHFNTLENAYVQLGGKPS